MFWFGNYHFDLLIDNDNLHIYHISGFEFTGKLQEALLAATPHNIDEIQKDLAFVDFSNIADYTREHTRAARYLASIRSLGEAKNIDMQALIVLCKNTNVDIDIKDNIINIQENNIMSFLEVLDRRRFNIELVKDSPERYKASSREKIVD